MKCQDLFRAQSDTIPQRLQAKDWHVLYQCLKPFSHRNNFIRERPVICNDHKGPQWFYFCQICHVNTPAQNQTFPDWTDPVWILALGSLFLFFFFFLIFLPSWTSGDSSGICGEGICRQRRPHIQILGRFNRPPVNEFHDSSLTLGQQHAVWCYFSGIRLSCVLFLQILHRMQQI